MRNIPINRFFYQKKNLMFFKKKILKIIRKNRQAVCSNIQPKEFQNSTKNSTFSPFNQNTHSALTFNKRFLKYLPAALAGLTPIEITPFND